MSFTPFSTGQTITGPLTVTGFTTLGGASTSGELFINAGSNTATTASANVLTPANTNGTAAQLSNLFEDYMVYLTVGTAGTALSVAIGPTSGVANTIYTAATATAGQTISFRLPAAWFWKWAATTATLAQQTAVPC